MTSQNPRVRKALDAMNALGVSDEEVIPVLKDLFKVYNKNWEYIEDDNYRTLVDAYFESKEDKNQAEGKRKAPSSFHDGERPKQKQHLEDKDVKVLSTNNTRKVLSVGDTEIPRRTSTSNPSQTSTGDMNAPVGSLALPSRKVLSVEDTKIPRRTAKHGTSNASQSSMGDVTPPVGSLALQSRFSEVERNTNLPCTAARGKLLLEASSSPGQCEGPVNKAKFPPIQRKSMSRDGFEKKLVPLRTEPKYRNGPASTSYSGPSNASNGNPRVKSLSAEHQNMHENEDNPQCDNNARNCDIDIASSSQGEVKISLNCDAALAHPNFHIPKLDDVMKSVEEKYLRSCIAVQPQLSMSKLLNEICGRFLKLGLSSNRKVTKPNYANSHNVVCLPQQAIAESEETSSHFISDITKGSENVKISLLDETASEELPKFNYIPQNIIYQSANVNISLARIADEGCCSDCLGNCLSLPFPCACSQETGGEFAYTEQGLLKEEFLAVCKAMKMEPEDTKNIVYCKECPLERSRDEYLPGPCNGHLVRKFIKECWRKCGCDMQCGNRVVQRGIRRKLQVFVTQQGKGWGVRALEDLPKGCFVCEYAGEILTNTELYDRILQNSSNERHTYPVTLDADWGSEGVLVDEEALCLDATYNGNVARFINHRCHDANLLDIPVEVETPDRHYYHLALFTNRNVKANEELTWDYGIDFDDHDHPIKAFQCRCGSAYCRDRQQKGKSKKLKDSSASKFIC